MVQGDCHDVGAVVEGISDAVAVVDVNVEIEDSFVLLGEDDAGQSNVVDVAEAGGVFRVCVVVSAGGIEGVLCLVVEDHLCAGEGGAGCEEGIFVKSFEDGAVGRSDSHIEGFGVELAFRSLLEGVQVACGVELFENEPVGGAGRDLSGVWSGEQPH